MAAQAMFPCLRMKPLMAEKASLIGLKSGEYGGKNKYFILLRARLGSRRQCQQVTHRSVIMSRTSGHLWIWQLSIMMMEFGSGQGFIWSNRPSMNCANLTLLNEPSTMSMVRMPSRLRAGRIEYLVEMSGIAVEYPMKTYLLPRMKKAFHVAFWPQIAHAQLWYVVCLSAALSSTNTSCSGVYWVPISNT